MSLGSDLLLDNLYEIMQAEERAILREEWEEEEEESIKKDAFFASSIRENLLEKQRSSKR